MTSMFDGICGKIEPGLCRLSMNGSIAVKTSAGYRAYDSQKGHLTNCDNFVLDIGEDFFFVMPASKVRPGDIILVAGRPRCVLKTDRTTITVINYEDMTVETLLPERHVFMGKSYLYGRIVSLFGPGGVKGKKGMGGMMKYMILSSLLGGKNEKGEKSSILPLLLMGGGKDDLFANLFEEEEEEENIDE